jgi:hypothetical protein
MANVVGPGARSVGTRRRVSAGVTLTLGILLLSVAGSGGQTAYPEPLWHADADADVDLGDRTRFFDKHVASDAWDRIAIVDDPTGRFGKVYEASLLPQDIDTGRQRAELSHALLGDGETELPLAARDTPRGDTREVWLGWRSLFGPDVVVGRDHPNDGNYMQLKGDADCGGPVVGLTIKGGRLTLRSERYLERTDGVAWAGPPMEELLDGSWHSFVLRVRFAADHTGELEVILDGRRQRMTNGRTQIRFPTMCPADTYIFPKFGVYSMDEAIGAGPQHWIESPRIGTTYLEAVPR